MRRLWRLLRFALALSDRDLENINYLCDKQLREGVNTASFEDELHRLHDLAVDAAS